jgi:alpha-beta hydrolase superfamily lysophospholipase
MKQVMQKKTRRRTIRRVIGILSGALLLYCALSMLASAIVFCVLFPRSSGESPLYYTFDELSPDVPCESFSFPSGGNTLYGRRYDVSDPKGLIVVVNGVRAGKDTHLPEIVAFVKAGWSVATWDATGIGASEGRGTIGLNQIGEDLAAFMAYRASSDAWDGLPVVLYGHSAGAYAAAAALPDQSEIKAAVCISGFDRPVTLMYEHARDRVGVLADLQYPFLYLECFFLFGADANDSAREAIDAVTTPVLIVGGDSDDLVPYANSLIRDPEQYRNPNMRALLITSAYRNEHSTPWLSPGAARYRVELTDEESADKALANELDPAFTEMILSFFEEALQ